MKEKAVHEWIQGERPATTPILLNMSRGPEHTGKSHSLSLASRNGEHSKTQAHLLKIATHKWDRLQNGGKTPQLTSLLPEVSPLRSPARFHEVLWPVLLQPCSDLG